MTRLRLSLWLLVLVAPLVAAPRAARIPEGVAPQVQAPSLRASCQFALALPGIPRHGCGVESRHTRRPQGPGLTEVPHQPGIFGGIDWLGAQTPTPRPPTRRLPTGPAALGPYVTTLPPPALS